MKNGDTNWMRGQRNLLNNGNEKEESEIADNLCTLKKPDAF